MVAGARRSTATAVETKEVAAGCVHDAPIPVLLDGTESEDRMVVVAAGARVAGVGDVFLATVFVLGAGTATDVVVIVEADCDVAAAAAAAVFVACGPPRDVPAVGDRSLSRRHYPM